VEPNWKCVDLLSAASNRLDLMPHAKRLFNANGKCSLGLLVSMTVNIILAMNAGVEIDDCLMIEDDDILFLSTGADFIAPTFDSIINNSNINSHNIHNNNSHAHNNGGNRDGNNNSGTNPQQGPGPSQFVRRNSIERVKIPAIVGGYVVGKLLGRGAFGEVRVGEHQLTGERVALKFLRKSEILSIGAAERTITEIQCLTALRHQNIIRLQQHLESPHHVILMFELMDGGDLKSFLHQRAATITAINNAATGAHGNADNINNGSSSSIGNNAGEGSSKGNNVTASSSSSRAHALPEEEARLVFHQIVSGVSFAHNQHICHRDLKLENIL
jgi:hypothetical protein